MTFLRKKVSIIVGAIALLIFASFYIYRFQYMPKIGQVTMPNSDSTLVKKEVLKLYGIPVDSFSIVTDVIKRNEMLLTILMNYNLPEGSLANLLNMPNSEFDLRKIKAGNRYTLFLHKDSLSTLRYFVYEHTPVDYVRIRFDDTVSVEIGHKEVTQKRKSATGTITTSL
jgi:hypothetical protein